MTAHLLSALLWILMLGPITWPRSQSPAYTDPLLPVGPVASNQYLTILKCSFILYLWVIFLFIFKCEEKPIKSNQLINAFWLLSPLPLSLQLLPEEQLLADTTSWEKSLLDLSHSCWLLSNHQKTGTLLSLWDTELNIINKVFLLTLYIFYRACAPETASQKTSNTGRADGGASHQLQRVGKNK